MLNLKISVPCPPREYDEPPSPDLVIKALKCPCPAPLLPPCREQKQQANPNIRNVDFKHDQTNAEKAKTISTAAEAAPGGVGGLVCDCLSNAAPQHHGQNSRRTRNMNNSNEVKGDGPLITEHREDEEKLHHDGSVTSYTVEEGEEGTAHDCPCQTKPRVVKRRTDPWTARKHKYVPKHSLPSEGSDEERKSIAQIQDSSANVGNEKNSKEGSITIEAKNVSSKNEHKIPHQIAHDKKAENVSKATNPDKNTDGKHKTASDLEKADHSAEMPESQDPENELVKQEPKPSGGSITSSKKSRRETMKEKWLESAGTDMKYLRQMQEKLRDKSLDMYDPNYTPNGELKSKERHNPQPDETNSLSEHEIQRLNDSSSPPKQAEQAISDASSEPNKRRQSQGLTDMKEKTHEQNRQGKERKESDVRRTKSGKDLMKKQEGLLQESAKSQQKDVKEGVPHEKNRQEKEKRRESDVRHTKSGKDLMKKQEGLLQENAKSQQKDVKEGVPNEKQTLKSKLKNPNNPAKVENDQIFQKNAQKIISSKPEKHNVNETEKNIKKTGQKEVDEGATKNISNDPKIEIVEDKVLDQGVMKSDFETSKAPKEVVSIVGEAMDIAFVAADVVDQALEESDAQSVATTSTKRKMKRKDDRFNPRRHTYVPKFPLHGDAIALDSKKSKNIEDPTETSQIMEGHTTKS